MRILVVEDEPTLAAQLAEGITTVGYVVDVAHNGVDGNFMGDTESYDAVVLDIGKRLSIGVIAGWSAMRYRSAGGFRRSAASTGAV